MKIKPNEIVGGMHSQYDQVPYPQGLVTCKPEDNDITETLL